MYTKRVPRDRFSGDIQFEETVQYPVRYLRTRRYLSVKRLLNNVETLLYDVAYITGEIVLFVKSSSHFTECPSIFYHSVE